MGETLLYSVLFLSGRQIPSLLGDMAYQLCNLANRCLGETEPVLEGRHNHGRSEETRLNSSHSAKSRMPSSA